MSTERKYREEIVRYGRRMLHERGFVATMDGNLSVRLDCGRILVTPTRGAMWVGDMVIVDWEGRRVEGSAGGEQRNRNASSDLSPAARYSGDCACAPPTATGFAAAGMALTDPLVCEVVMGLGCIPLARYGTPGTPELAETLEP